MKTFAELKFVRIFAPAIRKNGIADIERVSSKVCPKRVARVLEKKLQKVWKFQKYSLPLQSDSFSKKNDERTQNKVL